MLVEWLLAGPALAFEVLGAAWVDPIDLPFELDAASCTDLPAATVTATLDGARADWNATGLVQLDGGVTTSADERADGHNEVGCDAIAAPGPAVLAHAVWIAVGPPLEMVECDVTFFESNAFGPIAWVDQEGALGAGVADLGEVARHELGHCLGLDHSADPRAILYASAHGARTLSADDVAGLRSLYGVPCADADADGFDDCSADCDDGDPGVHPGATERCDGVDEDCDGVVDTAATETATSGNGPPAGEFVGGGYAYAAAWAPAEDRVLRSFALDVDLDAAGDVVFAVWAASGGGWAQVASGLAAAPAGPQSARSPDLGVALRAGETYLFSAAGAAGAVPVAASAEPTGPGTPLGGLAVPWTASFAEGSLDPLYPRLSLELQLPFDPDGDGVTDVCGDPCPLDPLDDADGDGLCADADPCDPVDDADGDGTCDAFDPCPADAANDADRDGRCADRDPCPADPADDADQDGACADADPCPRDPDDDADHDGACADADPCPTDPDDDADQDRACADADPCPRDPDDDADHDGLCGDQDPCPLDPDADGDGACADADPCPFDAEDDADHDGACADADPCPRDPDDDADHDGACADLDPCPADPDDDADRDGACDGVDPCPRDPDDDADHDGLCGDQDPCPLDPDADGDGACGDADPCPLDPDDDADRDGACADVDPCPRDPDDDADADGVCGDLDPCPADPGDDADLDGACDGVDPCPRDPDDDADQDGRCGDVDPCPLDPDDDADQDGRCGDVDRCPLDPGDDADRDGACADVDPCPGDALDDADGDGVCGDVDPCPYQPREDDPDGDGLCGAADPCPADPDRYCAPSDEPATDAERGCGCATGAPPVPGLLGALALALRGRRRRGPGDDRR